MHPLRITTAYHRNIGSFKQNKNVNRFRGKTFNFAWTNEVYTPNWAGHILPKIQVLKYFNASHNA